MDYIGFLTPDGTLIECDAWEHLDKATEIAEELEKRAFRTRLSAEEYLLKRGYIAIRSRDVYGMVGFLDENKNVIHLTEEQRKWFEAHYDEFISDKQKSIDEMMDNYDKW